jgi:transcriptional regulator with XRE-family HTH domain
MRSSEQGEQIAKEIGENARALRRKRKLSLTAAARKAEIGLGALSELENGKRVPALTTLKKLATAMGVKVRQLLPLDMQ